MKLIKAQVQVEGGLSGGRKLVPFQISGAREGSRVSEELDGRHLDMT